MVAILDYGLGNVRSIGNALSLLDIPNYLTKSRKEILGARALILPGVGSFGAGMSNLRSEELESIVSDFIKQGKPVLGICLGMQMLFSQGYEFGVHEGLGLVQGKVDKMRTGDLKLPHIGWNAIQAVQDDPVLNGLDGNNFYFVHSFCAEPSNAEDILASCEYGQLQFCAAVKKENIVGVQFHPEKSGEAGLTLLENFIKSE